MAAVGFLSAGLAFTGSGFSSLLAGLSYWLIGPVQFLHGHLMGKRRKRLQVNSEQAAVNRSLEPEV